MGNVWTLFDLQGLEDNHDFVADCCRYSENILSEEASAMGEFAFRVNIVAAGRVRAAAGNVARKIVADVLARPALRKSDWPMRTVAQWAAPQP